MRAIDEEELRADDYNTTVESWLEEANIVFYPENF